MFARQRLNALAERRHLLVLEADLHRRLIAVERESLRARWAGLRAAGELVGSHKPLFMMGGAVAGLFVVRHWRKLARWLPAAFTCFTTAALRGNDSTGQRGHG